MPKFTYRNDSNTTFHVLAAYQSTSITQITFLVLSKCTNSKYHAFK